MEELAGQGPVPPPSVRRLGAAAWQVQSIVESKRARERSLVDDSKPTPGGARPKPNTKEPGTPAFARSGLGLRRSLRIRRYRGAAV